MCPHACRYIYTYIWYVQKYLYTYVHQSMIYVCTYVWYVELIICSLSFLINLLNAMNTRLYCTYLIILKYILRYVIELSISWEYNNNGEIVWEETEHFSIFWAEVAAINKTLEQLIIHLILVKIVEIYSGNKAVIRHLSVIRITFISKWVTNAAFHKVTII